MRIDSQLSELPVVCTGYLHLGQRMEDAWHVTGCPSKVDSTGAYVDKILITN